MKQFIFVLSLFLLFSCSEKQSLPSQGLVDSIRVEQNHPKKQLAFLEDKRQIEAIIEFINTKRDGWSVPWYGPPVGTVYLKLYIKEKYVGNFYIGPYFFGRDHGNFWSQSSSKSEIKDLGALLDIKLLELIDASE